MPPDRLWEQALRIAAVGCNSSLASHSQVHLGCFPGRFGSRVFHTKMAYLVLESLLVQAFDPYVSGIILHYLTLQNGP